MSWRVWCEAMSGLGVQGQLLHGNEIYEGVVCCVLLGKLCCDCWSGFGCGVR